MYERVDMRHDVKSYEAKIGSVFFLYYNINSYLFLFLKICK